jgi:hypothetical protein
MKIDYVFPYVYCKDTLWQSHYLQTCRKLGLMPQYNSERFRNFGFLKYVFRSIATNAPWINKIHLLVAYNTQVPPWINRDTVNVVLHSKFIPAIHLPTFNSTTIEMYLKNIPELSEHFLYGNDDFYLNAPCDPSDFYDESGNPIMHVNKFGLNRVTNQFRKVVFNCYKKAKEFNNLKDNTTYFLKPEHQVTPMLLSTVTNVYDKFKDYIEENVTPFRSDKNLNQYVYSLTQYLSGNITDYKISSKYLSYEDGLSTEEICDVIKSDKYKLMCINDTEGFKSEDAYLIRQALKDKYPDICKYELP